MPPGQPLLRVEDLTLRFGGVTALADVNMTVESGTIHAIIGPNGAGKSSLLNCISGLYRPTSGSVVLRYVADDVARGGGLAADPRAASGAPVADIEDLDVRERALTSLPPNRVARLGVARSFQNIELFDHLTVLENMMLGRHVHMKHNVLTSMLWFGPARRQESPSSSPTRSTAWPAFKSREWAAKVMWGMPSPSGWTSSASVVPPETWKAKKRRSSSSSLPAE